MVRYVVRKLVLAVPLVICIVSLIFVLVELSPGDVSSKFFTPDTPPGTTIEARLRQVSWLAAQRASPNLPSRSRPVVISGNSSLLTVAGAAMALATHFEHRTMFPFNPGGVCLLRDRYRIAIESTCDRP